jgi:hypothetical protein
VGIRRRVELVATAYADELSLRSLAEISAITADQNVRIIGGQMASLLVPSLDGRFRPQEHGGRAFDSAPGLAPALAAEPIVIDTGARLLNGTVLAPSTPSNHRRVVSEPAECLSDYGGLPPGRGGGTGPLRQPRAVALR